MHRHPAGLLLSTPTTCVGYTYTAVAAFHRSAPHSFPSRAPPASTDSGPPQNHPRFVKPTTSNQRLRVSAPDAGKAHPPPASPKVTAAVGSAEAAPSMPRRGFGKRKGGYKGPVPGPDGEHQQQQQQQQGSGGAQKPAKRPPLTHFLCVPLVTAESRPRLQASLGRFREDVVRSGGCGAGVGFEGGQQELGTEGEPRRPEAAAVPEKAVRPVGTLHLTLGVMSLTSPQRVQEAVTLLQSLDLAAMLEGREPAVGSAGANPDEPSQPFGEERPKDGEQRDSPPQTKTRSGEASTQEATAPEVSSATSPEPLTINLKSLVSMHPPHQTSILYAHPEDPTNRLHPFCDRLRTLFTEKGLMVEDARPLKLHATVVNTIYAKAGGRHGRGYGKRGAFSRTSKEPVAGGPAAGAGEATTVDTLPGEASTQPQDTSSGHGPDARAPLRIDATDLLPRYADFVWAEGIRVGKVAICKMGAKKILAADGSVAGEEYEEVAAAEINP